MDTTIHSQLCILCEARAILLSCLETLTNPPFTQSTLANLNSCKISLFEIFIHMFLNECENLIQKGLKADYIKLSQNRTVLKGKLVFNEHIKHNLAHRERFFTQAFEYSSNIAPNRLIKSTLKFLSQFSLSHKTRQKLFGAAFVFQDISESTNIQNDFIQCRSMQRRQEYQTLLSWCQIFLEGNAFSPHSGDHKTFALLFPMEELFESFVSFWLRRTLKDYRLLVQPKEKYLIQNNTDSRNFFALKPDMVLKSKDGIIILDTKWKIPDKGIFDLKITPADIYQMWAYASKYSLENPNTRVHLIYPLCQKTQATYEQTSSISYSFKPSFNLYQKPITLHLSFFSLL